MNCTQPHQTDESMKRLFSLTISACLLFAASACSSKLDPEQEDFDLHGVIIQIEGYSEEHLRILVQCAERSLSEKTGKVWLILNDETELLRQEGRSFQRAGRDALKVGQEVRGWSSDVWLYSNPPQAGARRVVIHIE